MRTVRRIVTVLTLAFICTAVAAAQSPTSSEAVTIPVSNKTSANSIWPEAQPGGAYKGKVFVVTLDQPDHRHACRIQSITADKLICSRGIGGARTYLRQQVVALIIPGDEALRVRLVLVLNAVLGATIWGTVVLAAACPPCAVVTGVLALGLFGAAGGVLYVDGQPDRFLYLAAGQHLSKKLGYVED